MITWTDLEPTKLGKQVPASGHYVYCLKLDDESENVRMNIFCYDLCMTSWPRYNCTVIMSTDVPPFRSVYIYERHVGLKFKTNTHCMLVFVL